MTKVKGHKMDPYLVSKQIWEIQYIARKFDVRSQIVLEAIIAVGRSRKRVYNILRQYDDR